MDQNEEEKMLPKSTGMNKRQKKHDRKKGNAQTKA